MGEDQKKESEERERREPWLEDRGTTVMDYFWVKNDARGSACRGASM